jgi:acylphosphatase
MGRLFCYYCSRMKHYNITITGRVQGVFFRKYTAEKASALGIAGFVRNEPDGSVYCEAEAEKEVLDRFVAWCRLGSPMSEVTGVMVEEAPAEAFGGFGIRR